MLHSNAQQEIDLILPVKAVIVKALSLSSFRESVPIQKCPRPIPRVGVVQGH